MKKGLVIGIISVLSVLIMFFALVAWGFGVHNKEVSLRNRAEAQQKNLEVVHDEVWKTIAEKAKVSNEYKDAFAEIYPQIMQNRYESGGSLMKWIQESNPDFDSSLYKDLMDTIEGKRVKFSNSQTMLLDIAREHKTLTQSMPSALIVGSRPPIEVKLITSTRSKDAAESGVDDEILTFD